ncbi:hypothetical protein [Cellulophaga sp. Hel_I_12]|uniref:hypothetical protein n=1 Tax=Cellulophaga sp. Hel_I_12 TaxID=1249972 RepID=UPI000645B8A9|nr:hypothetical protein [Cellulophaga sp. Hel_I_12]
MAVLKKIKASTLMETMVATVLIVVVFMMASLLLNTIFTTYINGNTQPITEKLQELEYEYYKEKIIIPYSEEWNDWEIQMSSVSPKQVGSVKLEATNNKSKKTVSSYIYEIE